MTYVNESDIQAIRDNEKISIILELIGHFEGIGETNYDKKSLENLNFLDLLLCRIFEYLEDNATYEGCEGSRIELKESSIELLKLFKDDIDRMLEE